jgi:hypothetical protein
MKPNALEILSKALSIRESFDEKAKRNPRLLELLRSPDAKVTSDWYMCVPAFFNEALDIRMTQRMKQGIQQLVWTQGSTFSFKEGDKIYDTAKAYLQWSEALRHIRLCVSVRSAVNSAPEQNKAGVVVRPRNPGKVLFTLLSPNAEKTRIVEYEEHELTQDDFVRFLIAGPDPALRAKLR